MNTTARPYGLAPSAYRLPPDLRVGPVHLQVADLARSLPYYRDVLGLRVLASTPTSATLVAHGEEAPLVHLDARAGVHPVGPRGRLGLFHFAILLPDRASLGRFVAHLAAIGAQAGASDHLVSEAIYLTDPDGLGIEVYADRPQAQWRHEHWQLVMATEPLDLRDLVASTEGIAWTGMPAGTRMGHLHLHVGDLARAEAFYHEALGLDKVVWSYPGALFLSAGGYHHHLGLNTWAAGAPPAGPDDAGLLAWELRLPSRGDVEAALESLGRAGAAVERIPSGGIVEDPWGTRLRIVSS